MGIFTKFKQMFSKNIEHDEMYDSELVHLYSRQPAVFHIGYNIVVRPGFNAVFVVRDRVTDVLPSGKYRIGMESLPITFHKLKLDKIRKNGNPMKFKADVYFVNSATFKGLAFNSDYAYINKTKELGKVVAYAEGTYDLQVQDAGDLVAYLLLDRAYVTNKQSLDILGRLVGNNVNKLLEKSNMTIKDIFKTPKTAEQYINEHIINGLPQIGVNVENVALKYFNINSKLQQKINNSIEDEKEFVTEYQDFSKDDVTVATLDPSTFVVENNTEELTTKTEVDDYVVERNTPLAKVEGVTPTTNEPVQVSYRDCPNCGQQVEQGDNFCKKCGFNLDSLQ